MNLLKDLRFRFTAVGIIIVIFALTVSPISVAQKYEIVSTEKLKAMFDKKQSFVLIDARSKQEYKNAHIIKAINIPAETFAFRSDILPKEKKIIVTCNTGSRSYLAYRKLIQLAYPNIYQTLIADWKDAGMKLEK